MIYITSIMRNSTGYLPRYASQVGDLADALAYAGQRLTVFVAENDSTDGTLAWLEEWARYSADRYTVVGWKLDHGGPAFGSVDDPVRWRNIARTWNKLYDRLAPYLRDADRVIYVETDLIWSADTMLRLIEHTRFMPAVAPMSMQGSIFYDTWGHRAGGKNFQNEPPFHPALVDWRGGLMQLDSAGSCMALRAEVARLCRLSEADAMIGHDIYRHGFSLWLDPTLKVVHP